MKTRTLIQIIRFALIVVFIWYVFQWITTPNGYNIELVILLVCHIFMAICFEIICSKGSFYIFEPILFVFFLYYMIFVFSPIRNIFIGEVSELGVNTMGGCIKGTIIFMLGFIGMMIGYYIRDPGYNYESIILEDNNIGGILTYSWFLWLIGVGSYLIYNQMIGRSMIYMLTFGMFGGGLKDTTSFEVDFLSMIIYISFLPMMMILIHSKVKFQKILVFFVTCIPLATRGFRSMLIIPFLAPIIYYYLKEKKSPSIRTSGIVLSIMILLLGAIAYTRASLRFGEGIDFTGYHYSVGSKGALNYFGSYKVYYGAIENYPSKHMYTLGKQLIYTLIMYIPRGIWPGKPYPAIYEAIGNSVGSVAVSAGSAWPNIGEYYTEFGIIGVIVLEFVLGSILQRMKRLYNNAYVSTSSLALYSIFLPALLSIIAYGYTAGNTPQFLFMALPMIGYKRIIQRGFV